MHLIAREIELLVSFSGMKDNTKDDKLRQTLIIE